MRVQIRNDKTSRATEAAAKVLLVCTWKLVFTFVFLTHLYYYYSLYMSTIVWQRLFLWHTWNNNDLFFIPSTLTDSLPQNLFKLNPNRTRKSFFQQTHVYLCCHVCSSQSILAPEGYMSSSLSDGILSWFLAGYSWLVSAVSPYRILRFWLFSQPWGQTERFKRNLEFRCKVRQTSFEKCPPSSDHYNRKSAWGYFWFHPTKINLLSKSYLDLAISWKKWEQLLWYSCNFFPRNWAILRIWLKSPWLFSKLTFFL